MPRQGLIRRRDQHVRRHALFDPSLQREHRIVLGVERDRCDAGLAEIDRAGAALAVVHARDHEEPVELLHALQPAIRGDDAIE
jgi:hypothetical protein